MLSTVDLPQPEGPISAISSPRCTSNDTASSAGTSPPRANRFATDSILMSASGISQALLV